MRADARHHAGAEILLDALLGTRQDNVELASLELAAMGTVMDPLALGFDIFAGGNLRDRTNQRHEVPLATHVHAHDTKAALWAVEGDTLNDTSESFQGRRSDGR